MTSNFQSQNTISTQLNSQNTTDNMRVAIRIRPALTREMEKGIPFRSIALTNKENKISTTNIKIKTEMNTGNKGGKFAQYQFSKIKKITTENSGINDNKNNSKIRAGSTNSRGNKNETVSIERQSSRNKIGGNEISGSKVVTVKTTQVIVGKSGQGSRNNSRSNSITRSKKESSVTTTKTVTKTVIKNESSQSESQGSVVRKFRSIRMIKKDNK